MKKNNKKRFLFSFSNILKPKFFIIFEILFIFLISFSFSASTSANLTSVLSCACGTAYNLLPPISMLLVLAAALTFAAGQIFGAETRARATGWATAMITGAIVGFFLAAILPSLVMTLANQPSSSWKNYCSGDILSGSCSSSSGGGPGGSGGGGGDPGVEPDKDPLPPKPI
jgi:uncharacterized membrane protein YgcG